MPILS
ncbi:unnamed protein product, partial [Allacma fusca]